MIGLLGWIGLDWIELDWVGFDLSGTNLVWLIDADIFNSIFKYIRIGIGCIDY
jgi:hypothetical protein